MPTVGYVGGSDFDGGFSFADDERLCHYDALILGFVNEWRPLQGCTGPSEAGLGAMPGLLTNGCIQKGPQFLGPSPAWRQCGVRVHCGGVGEGTVGSAVLSFQQRGKRLLLSIGGQNSHADEMDTAKGVALAHALWNMYLGGEDPRYEGWRPFGPHVVLDGVDLDLEQTPPSCESDPASAACAAVQEGWWGFVNTMRALMDADTRKEYLLTAVPINTKFADPREGGFPGWGAYTHGVLPGIAACPKGFEECHEGGCPEGSASLAALNAQPRKSLFAVMHKIDYTWPQFYPSPVSITMNSDECWLRDYLAWAALGIHAAKVANEPNRNRVGIGVPFSRSAANGGQIDAAVAVGKVQQALTLGEGVAAQRVLRERFGGMFGWDELHDQRQNRGNLFGRQLALALSQPSFLALVDGAAAEAGRVCPRSNGRRLGEPFERM